MTRNDLCARAAALLSIAFALGVTTSAWAERDESFILDFEKAHALSNGDMNQLEYFEQCATEEPECAMFAGTMLRKHRRTDDAARFYELALANGWKAAATSLALLHTEQRNRVEALAWSRLAYALDDPRRELSKRETSKLASIHFMAENYRAMNDDQREEADLRARQLIDEWAPTIQELIAQHGQETPDSGKVIEIVERSAPNYPFRLARNRLQGFTTVYALVGLDGKVIDAIPLDYNHRLFANASVEVIKKWVFRIIDTDRAEPMPVTQTLEFRLPDAAGY